MMDMTRSGGTQKPKPTATNRPKPFVDDAKETTNVR